MIFDEVTDKNKLTPFYGPRCTYMVDILGRFEYQPIQRLNADNQ